MLISSDNPTQNRPNYKYRLVYKLLQTEFMESILTYEIAIVPITAPSDPSSTSTPAKTRPVDMTADQHALYNKILTRNE